MIHWVHKESKNEIHFHGQCTISWGVHSHWMKVTIISDKMGLVVFFVTIHTEQIQTLKQSGRHFIFRVAYMKKSLYSTNRVCTYKLNIIFCSSTHNCECPIPFQLDWLPILFRCNLPPVFRKPFQITLQRWNNDVHEY